MMLTQQMQVVQLQEAPLCVNDAGDAARVVQQEAPLW